MGSLGGAILDALVLGIGMALLVDFLLFGRGEVEEWEEPKMDEGKEDWLEDAA